MSDREAIEKLRWDMFQVLADLSNAVFRHNELVDYDHYIDRIFGLHKELSGTTYSITVKKEPGEWPKLPRECICETYPELAEIGEVGDGQYHACEDYRERSIEAHYVQEVEE